MSNGKVPIYDYEQDERAYENTAAWFLGPKAENHGFMEQAFGLVVDRLLKARKAYKPDDPVRFITHFFYMILPTCAGLYYRRSDELWRLPAGYAEDFLFAR